MDKFGRRFTLQLAYIPLILSWIVLGYADSYKTILIGRIILGTTFGKNINRILNTKQLKYTYVLFYNL